MNRFAACVLVLLLAALGLPASALASSVPSGVIAFETTRDGNSEIYVMNADGTGVRNLTNNPARDFNATLSWDGKKIVFSSDREDPWAADLWTMNIDGSGLRQLTSGTDTTDWNSSWSPDGRTVAFLRYWPNEEAGVWDYDVFSVGVSTGRVRNLTRSPHTMDIQPSFTTDGRILFVRDYDIWSMAANGTGLKRLTTDGATNEWPHMSPNGSRIVFHSTRGGWYDIWTMKPNGRDLVQLTSDPGAEAWPSWSPDGTQVVFGWNPTGSWSDLAVVNEDGSGFTALQTGGLCGFAGGDSPSWAPGALVVDPPPPPPDPDTAAVAFTSDAESLFGDVWVARADGSEPVNLTGGDCWEDASPQWSADGDKIAFDSNRSGSYQIHTMNPDGTDVTQITTEDIAWYVRRPQWSPDGTKMAFYGEGSAGVGTYVMDLETGLADLILDDGSWPSSWYPSERILVHRTITDSQGNYHWSVWSILPDGSDPKLLSPELESASDGAWSPDATKIAFTLGQDNATMDADGSDVRILDPDPSDSEWDGWPSWVPDGSAVSFSSDHGLGYGLFLVDPQSGEVSTLLDTSANEAGPVWRPVG